MMRKEEFLSFITDALEQMVEKKGYSEVNFGSFESSDEYDYDDYDYDEEDEDYSETAERDGRKTSSDSVFNTNSSQAQRRKADAVSDEFTSDLFETLINKFKPSKEVKQRVFDTKQSFESIPDEVNTACFGGAKNPFSFSYTQYFKPLEIPEDVIVDSSGDVESTLKSFDTVLSYVMKEVERVYGGADRITDIAVFSDIVIINKVSFEPILKDSLIASLPYDLQYSVSNGCFAYLFDFSYLRRFKNLVNFSVDSVDFLYSKVRLDLGKNKDFEPKDMFSICRSLNVLRVGEYVITRQDRNAYSDVFAISRKSTEIADKIEDLGMKGVKGTWSCAKDIFFEKNTRLLWKGIKLTAVAGAATGLTLATYGFKVSRFLGNTGKSLAKGVGNIIDAVKDNA